MYSISAAAAQKPAMSIGWLRVPPKIYFKAGCLEVAMAEFSKKKRVFIVTDKPLYDLGVSRRVTELLDSMRVQHKTYYHVESDPELGMVLDGIFRLYIFQIPE
jgi:acetaldehyde dehydrogenase/alcohol dehydrogenase